MNSIKKLQLEMKEWLLHDPKEPLSISDCFRIANSNDEWRVKLFYATFAPYMANILDDQLNNIGDIDKLTKRDDGGYSNE